jgi:colanic acid/amylovoran biosynthesis glycosyltransferase
VRIALVVPEFPTLSETFISNKVAQLINRKHEIIVFCTKFNSDLFEQMFKTGASLSIIVLDKKRMISFLLKNPKAILKRNAGNLNRKNLFNSFRVSIINRCNADIIHFEFSGLALEYVPILSKLKGKKIVSCRGTAEKLKLITDKSRHKKMKELLDAVDAVHCVSNDMRHTILPYCSHPEKAFVNYPAIDIDRFKRRNEKSFNGDIIILSVGRLTFIKGYITGLLAIAQLKQLGLSFKWYIIGDGIQYEELLFHIDKLQLQHEVLLKGAKKRDEIIALFETADIFFLPSLSEGVSNAALEAMSMELPVVSTNCGGMEEVITHGINGMLADVYDHTKLAENLTVLMKDAALRNKMGKAARQRVIENFEIKKQIDRFEEVYQQFKKNI